MDRKISALGDCALTITLSDAASAESITRARTAAAQLRAAKIPHVEEVLSAYAAVTVFYDALHLSFTELSKLVLDTLETPTSSTPITGEGRLHVIRTTYNGADLDEVAAATGLKPEDVIELHSSRIYEVDVLGFVPGFAYLSELDARLELPRRPQPRQRVPAGSVAIASRLTGIYPFETPGGWHILGRTDEVMFDPRRAEPSLFRAGDKVRFEPVR